MKTIMTLMVCLFTVPIARAQTDQTPTAADIEFIHYFLSTFDDSKAVLFGLNEQEAAAAKAAAKSYATALNTFAVGKAAVESGKQALSSEDQAATRALADTFTNTVTGLANRFFSTVRPERAAYLHLQAQLVERAAAGVKKALKATQDDTQGR
jgi:hypothetical protein